MPFGILSEIVLLASLLWFLIQSVKVAEYYFFCLNILLKNAHNISDAVFFSFVIQKYGHLPLSEQLGVHQLNMASIVNDVAILINEPARRVDWSPEPVHLVAVLILQDHRLVVVIVFEVAEALVRIEVETLHFIRQRQLIFVI